MVRHLRLVTLLFVVTGLAVSGGSLFGQSAPVADEFKDLHFRSIGPASMSGRVTDLGVYEANPSIYYVATAHGGVWKTTSAGALYEPQLQDQGPMSMGAVAVSQRDPNVAFAGGGESNNRQSSSWGDGVYKTTDGGRTWRNIGLRNSKHINRIVIDPTDHNIVFVAATGSLWGAGGDRGVYKSTDGGQNWKLVLKGPNDWTGANELTMSHTDRNDRPINRWISWVRPDTLRSTRSGLDPGSIEYSAVTQPVPRPFIQRGTSSCTDAVQSTRVRPNVTRVEPRVISVKSRSNVTGRSSSAARPSARMDPPGEAGDQTVYTTCSWATDTGRPKASAPSRAWASTSAPGS